MLAGAKIYNYSYENASKITAFSGRGQGKSPKPA